MSYVILLAGLPAAGKTVFSEFIAKELNIPVISKDFIKEILFDVLGFQSREEKNKLGFASRDIIYGIAEKFMNLGIPVILENNFEDNGKQQLIDLINKYNYQSITVRFEGDLETVYKRFIARNHSDSRHPGHITNRCYPLKGGIEESSDLTFEQYREMVEKRGIADFNIGGDLICVDTTNLETIDYKKIAILIREKIKMGKRDDAFPASSPK